LLTAHAVGAAPAHLAAKMTRGALAGTAAGGVSLLLAHLVAATNLKLAAAAVLLATGVAVVVSSRHSATEMSRDSIAVAPPTNSGPDPSPAATTPLTNHAATVSGMVPIRKGSVLHLEIVASSNGKPIPLAPIEYRAWAGEQFEGKELLSDQLGRCDVIYPTNVTELELTTRKDHFADTRLLWRPANGDVIPAHYALLLDRPTPIGGRVVDEDGNPVVGANVGWGCEEDPAALKLPQNHEFGWINATTGKDGRWRINRIAEEMIPRLCGQVAVGRDKAVEQQLRDGTYVSKLGKSITVTCRGLVVDADGTPVPGASVLVGRVGMGGSKGETQADGTFSIGACGLGKQLVTAASKNFAATTVEAALAADADPIRLVVHPGKVLRLRVVDKAGNPIPRAHIDFSGFDLFSNDTNAPKPFQVEFGTVAGDEGRAVWTNAPDAELAFNAGAPGYSCATSIKLRPDAEEHLITLQSALLVHGRVDDEASGQRIPHIRIAIGWLREPMEGTTNVTWSTQERFWKDFANGAYNYSLEEAVSDDGERNGYILKFIADGYSPFISRVMARDEGDVQLDVTLRRAAETTVTVYKPNGQLASGADIGLVFPGVRLSLAQGGFIRENFQAPGSILRTEANGTFQLPPDGTITHVIAASPDGYAEETPATLSTNPVLQLESWGRLEGTCVINGQPIVGRLYVFELAGGLSNAVSFTYSATTDAQGGFSVSHLPPGHLQMVRHFWTPPVLMPDRPGHCNGDRTPFEVRPDETTVLNLGASNCVVTARLRWPEGLQRQPFDIQSILTTPMPTLPPELMIDSVARTAFQQSDEFKAAEQKSHIFGVKIREDGTLFADNVPAGEYMLSVAVCSGSNSDTPSGNPFRTWAWGSVNVTVPSDPPSGNLDAGVIELHAASTSP
jgi:protocatechuate 3,4-dioxygenase beta subunit